MRVLCVAEKPSIAKSISDILSNGQRTTVSALSISFVFNAPSLTDSVVINDAAQVSGSVQ